jgi:hypothetical protein
LGGEGHGLALQRLARGFAGQAHVFEVVALELAIEAQFAGQLGARLDVRLVGAEEGAGLERDVHAFVHRAGAQLDAFGAVAWPAFSSVNCTRALLTVRLSMSRRIARWLRAFRLAGRRFAWRGGRGAGNGRVRQRLADVFPVAVAIGIAGQGRFRPSTHVAHLHFAAQQRQHAHGQAEHLQVGERLGGVVQGGDAGFVQLQAQPREQAPADVAIERQLDVGLVAGHLANLVFVVVGIEEVGQGEAQRHNDQQQPEKYQTQDFAERFHGRVLVVEFVI